MRKFIILVSLFVLLFGSATAVDAQRAFSNQELNARISALRTRLNDYQQKSVRKTVDKTKKEAETVQVKVEKAFVELDASKDVAVTVLFHDNEFHGNSTLLPAKDLLAANSDKTVAAAANSSLSDEQRLRNEKFDALRRKVQLATRRSRDEALSINNQMAKIGQ